MNDTSKPRHGPVAPPSPHKILRSAIGAFIGLSLVGYIAQLMLNDESLTFEIGAFGATAVLLYAAPLSPYAQPWNVLVGHVTSALVGVAVFRLFGANWFSAALAVTLAIAAMQLTSSIHPPGGASALIAVLGAPDLHQLGFSYAFFPVGLGALVMIAVALVSNNIANPRRWPEYWLATTPIARLHPQRIPTTPPNRDPLP
ncbi:HPP family protein [Marimonas arenosa]|uniref:HPP family protein n=1 Tax=Marimonas arenosa TaxID=1795305 RepID=A0AAE4B4U9_9RHOB|nr:HPP family protein [Marimonas arenosa]MDQ2090487.1 HPP family protein [Marimonas arenosa]